MIKRLSLLSLTLFGFTACNPLAQMTCLINESTNAINCNREAVQYTTVIIEENTHVIRASTQTVKTNYDNISKISEQE